MCEMKISEMTAKNQEKTNLRELIDQFLENFNNDDK